MSNLFFWCYTMSESIGPRGPNAVENMPGAKNVAIALWHKAMLQSASMVSGLLIFYSQSHVFYLKWLHHIVQHSQNKWVFLTHRCSGAIHRLNIFLFFIVLIKGTMLVQFIFSSATSTVINHFQFLFLLKQRHTHTYTHISPQCPALSSREQAYSEILSP